jgi:hypothetical protein
MCISIYVGNSLAGMYGIATAALGMLSTLATGEGPTLSFIHELAPSATINERVAHDPEWWSSGREILLHRDSLS